MPHISLKKLEEQIPNHLSQTVKEIMRRHLREEHLKKLEESQDEKTAREADEVSL